MNGGYYSQGKRQRDADKARKKRDKAERRAMRREQGPAEPEVITAEDVTGVLPTVEEAMRAIHERATTKSVPTTIPCRLFVGSLSNECTTATLTAAFEAFGPVTDSVVVSDRDTGRSKGFGFVTMADRKHAASAIEQLDGSELDGRHIVVNIATERQPRPR